MDEDSKSSKALKSGIWYTISSVVLKGINFITTPIFARLLSLEDFGQYSNYLSWNQILMIVVTLNLVSTLVCAKYDYEHKFDIYTANMMEFTVILTALAMVFINVFAAFSTWVTNLGVLDLNILLLSILFSSCLNIFQSRERLIYNYKRSTILSMAIAILNILISLLLVYAMNDDYLARIIGGSVSTVVIGFIITIYFIGHHNAKIDISMWTYALPITLPYILHSLSLMLLNSMDRIQITKYCGAASNALYSLAYSVAAVVTLLLISLNDAYVPWFADKLINGEFDLIKKTNKVYQLTFSVGVVGIMLIAPEVLIILGGKKYDDSLSVIPPVILACVFQFFYTMYVNTEQIKKNTFKMALGSISAAVLNYVLNLIFIPKYGYIAAAYTTLASYFWLYIIHVIIVNKMGFSIIYNFKFEILLLISLLGIDLLVAKIYSYTFLRFAIILIFALLILNVIYKRKKEIQRIIVLIKRG